ncbi:MAG: ParB/RepB/Spo0J family partition protein [Elusimicrobiaceae bacterium]|nr:ParB/RepB/Spo0J family partition protein [Clostridia bacterium]MBP3514427.1 ParB/RepB/Spo0J family partition protein [Elusimicrobiaceae bacterium]
MKGLKKGKYKVSGEVMEIPIADILPNPDQPRKRFDRVKLIELAESIAENGILQPLIVTMRNDRPVLIAGERRLRAAKMAGFSTVPCVRAEAEGMRQALLAMVENLQREDMNCFETADGIYQLIHTYGLTQEEAALRLGYSQSAVANKLRLLKLSPEERRLITEGGLSERHARALLRLQKAEERRYALSEIIKKSMTVAQTDALVERMLNGKVARHRREIPLIRDVRVFFNTVEHALDTMRRGGVEAESKRFEREGYIEYVIKIPR